MGYMTELNTLLRLPKTFDPTLLNIGQTYTVTKEKERTFPIHIAILLTGDDWTFYGYCVVNESIIKENKTQLSFSILSLFTPQEQKLYQQKFLEATQKTGEV